MSISIIICSREKDISQELYNNISRTVGCDYELIIIDNSSNEYNIFQAYNEGVKRSHGDILCFMHDDILFRTLNWGDIIKDVFHDETIGLVGFAGTHFLSSAPFYWTYSPFISEHNLTNDKGAIIECFQDYYFDESGITDLVAVDGFCYFIRKSLFNTIRYDDITYSGFHAYDMDICMQVQRSEFRVCACNRILIEHFWSESAAATKKGYEIIDHNLNLFVSKFKNDLPIHKGVDGVPESVWERLDGFFKSDYEAKKIRTSKSYRLGRVLLHPFRWLRSINNSCKW